MSDFPTKALLVFVASMVWFAVAVYGFGNVVVAYIGAAPAVPAAGLIGCWIGFVTAERFL